MTLLQSKLRFSVLCLLIVIGALPLAAADRAPALAMEVRDIGVVVENVTPGGEVVLLSCGKRATLGPTFNETKPRIVADDDGDGRVVLEEEVPSPSVWIAVDAKTGALATGASPEFPIYVRPIEQTLYRKDADEQILALEEGRRRMLLLLVRPQHGAWVLRAREGEDGDGDNESNGKLLLTFEHATPFGNKTEKAPKHLKAGDLVFAVDLGHLDIFLGEVTQ